MIITRTPLRISFVGGGSDRPEFTNHEDGATIAASIDKYVYVTVHNQYNGRNRVSYSQMEDVSNSREIQHDLVRESIRLMGGEGLEVHSIADLPGGTGLGSSSSFTVGLLQALDADHNASPQWLARTACRVELELCHKSIGRQDQYVAAFGGINQYGFRSDGKVTVAPIEVNTFNLNRHCLLLDTEIRRTDDAGSILRRQNQDRADIRTLVGFVPQFAEALIRNDMEACGTILDLCWQIKRNYVLDSAIDTFYNAAREWGAWGGKLCGAGGGGFLLFMAPPERHETIASALRLRKVPIQFGVPGARVLYSI